MAGPVPAILFMSAVHFFSESPGFAGGGTKAGAAYVYSTFSFG